MNPAPIAIIISFWIGVGVLLSVSVSHDAAEKEKIYTLKCHDSKGVVAVIDNAKQCIEYPKYIF